MKNYIKRLTETVKELNKLLKRLEELMITIISIAGWIHILIHLFQ